MHKQLLLTGALAMLAGPLGAEKALLRKASPEVEQALRERVNQFYSLYQQSNFRQAEALVAEESKDRYYRMSKLPVRQYRIETIDWAEDLQSAKVLVACHAISTRTAAQAIWTPVSGLWRLIDGAWYLDMPKRETSPWGPMTFADPSKFMPEPFRRPTPEAVTVGAYRIDQDRLVFPRLATGTIGRTVKISNNLPGDLPLEVEPLRLPGVTTVLTMPRIRPNSETTLNVYYSPAVAQHSGTHQLRLHLLGQIVTIELVFE